MKEAAAHLWLIRHGQTDWNLQGRYQGQADPPLNETGWRQAREVPAALGGTQFAALYSSDLRRARDTADVLAQALSLPVQVDARLREVRLGVWEGMLFTDIQARYPDAWQARETDALHARPPGGENLLEVAERTWAAADDMARAHPGGEVLVVAHGLVLATLRVRAHSLPLAEAYAHVPDNGQPERVTWRTGGSLK